MTEPTPLQHPIVILLDSFTAHIWKIIGAPTPPPPILYYYIIRFFPSSYSENHRNSSFFPPTTPRFHYYIIVLLDSYMVYLPYVAEPPLQHPIFILLCQHPIIIS